MTMSDDWNPDETFLKFFRVEYTAPRGVWESIDETIVDVMIEEMRSGSPLGRSLYAEIYKDPVLQKAYETYKRIHANCPKKT